MFNDCDDFAPAQTTGPRQPEGLNFATEQIAALLAEQRALIQKVYAVLSSNGLLKPAPPSAGEAEGSDQPKATRLSDRLLDLNARISHHNTGLMELLQRLDV